jgi:hypothetical protein
MFFTPSAAKVSTNASLGVIFCLAISNLLKSEENFTTETQSRSVKGEVRRVK